MIGYDSDDDLINEKDQLLISSDNILYIGIENSFVNFIPTAEFEIIDDGYLLTSKMKKINYRICLNILGGNGGIETFWIIKNIEILNNTSESIQYKIYCDLDIAIPLYRPFTYATFNNLEKDEEGGENPLQIIKSILTSVNIDLYNDTPDFYKPGESADENEDSVGISGHDTLKNRYAFPECNELVHFISNQNMYVIDAVKYLLARAVGTLEITPPVYFIYNIKDKKGFLTTRSQLFEADSIAQQPLVSNLPFLFSTANPIGRTHQMNDVHFESPENGGIENAKLLYNYHFFKYGQKDRLWENNIVDKIEIDKILTVGIDRATQESIFMKPLINENNELENNYSEELTNYYQFPTIHEQNLYDVLKNLELFSSNIRFDVEGDLNFDIGQVITIAENENTVKESFGGHWMITAIKHSFRNQVYTCNIVCSRTYYNKGIR